MAIVAKENVWCGWAASSEGGGEAMILLHSAASVVFLRISAGVPASKNNATGRLDLVSPSLV